MEKIKHILYCMDGNDLVAHGVETENGLVIGTKIGVSYESKHELAKKIQKLFNITPIEHLGLMKKCLKVMNPIQYQALMDSCNPISWEEAEEMVK